MDRSFSETEKVNLLAEIIKSSPVPHTALLDIVHQYRIEPQWSEVSRPPGRSPQECRELFHQLRTNQPPPSAVSGRPPPSSYHPPPQISSRPFPPVESQLSIIGGRALQPRPEGVSHATYTQPGPAYPFQAQEQQAPKKRGRPSNQEKEERRRLGIPSPPGRARKRSKPAQNPAPTSPSSTHGSNEAQPPSEGPPPSSSHRHPLPFYSDQSPTSAGPARQSPMARELPPPPEQRTTGQPLSHHERTHSHPQRLPPPQTPFHTPTQSLPPPPEQPIHFPRRLSSPTPHCRAPSMPLPGPPILPPPAPSPHASSAPPPFPPSQTFQRPTEPLRRRSPPGPTSELIER